MDMCSAMDTKTGNATATRVASVSPPRRIPQRVRASLDRQAKQAACARIAENACGASSRVSWASVNELSAEAVELSNISEARAISRRKQRRAGLHKETAPSFVADRGQDLRDDVEVSTGATRAPAPGAEISRQPVDHDGTTVAKKKARLVEKAEFRPYARVMRKAPTDRPVTVPVPVPVPVPRTSAARRNSRTSSGGGGQGGGDALARRGDASVAQS